MALVELTGQGEVTQLLQAWRNGDQQALDKLIPLVYDELKRLARSYMIGERAGHTLQATALVHEAYARLIETPRVQWRDRNHFFAICAQLMRRALVDYSRSRAYLKRGGGVPIVSLGQAPEIGSCGGIQLFEIDEALTALATFDLRKSQVVELRFFGGLTVEETAEVLKISSETVLRDWKIAKAWLLRKLDSVTVRGA
jgi:RNA polymerase sigma-70 factor, ECF subfamily